MFMITGISGNFKLVIAGVAVSAMMIWYLDELLNDKINSRRDELLRGLSGNALKAYIACKCRCAYKRGMDEGGSHK